MNNDNEIIRLENNGDILPVDSVESVHHSHHSSHSHRHRSHHSSKRKKGLINNKKLKRFWKKNKYRISNIAVAVLFAVVLIILGVILDKKDFSDISNENVNNSNGIISTQSSIQIEIPVFYEEVVLINPAVEKYIFSEKKISVIDIFKEYSSLGRLDKGIPVNLWYKINGIPLGYGVTGAELLVADNNNFNSPLVYKLSSDNTDVDVYNLKTGTKYYFRFIISLSNNTKTSVEGSFRTAVTPRMLSVDGVANLRDIGGWRTVDGKKTRQGLIYRSAELDGAVDSKYMITQDGVSTMLTVLGIRTDMDLRAQTDNVNNTHPLGAGVNHIYYNSPMYSDIFSSNGKESVRKVFSDLGNKNNYPVLIHCTHGFERTGTICYILEALLGLSEEDLMKEYQLSAMYHGELWSLNQMNEFIGRLKSYDGETIQKKAENYLLSIGVTASEIASIREICLEA